jgi:hypothetical protein
MKLIISENVLGYKLGVLGLAGVPESTSLIFNSRIYKIFIFYPLKFLDYVLQKNTPKLLLLVQIA